MKWRVAIARLLGRVGFWFVNQADAVAADWEPRSPLHGFTAESDVVLNERNCSTIPCAPPVPTIDPNGSEPTLRIARTVLPPWLPVAGERRIICVDSQSVSVTPPAGCFWQAGGSS